MMLLAAAFVFTRKVLKLSLAVISYMCLARRRDALLSRDNVRGKIEEQ